MSKVQYIYLYFNKNDQDILAWTNMIKESGQSLNTWVQGILVAEVAREDLSIGAVFIPPQTQTLHLTTPRQTSNLFGDDTTTLKEEERITGWNVRGENGKLKNGSILSIKVTRPIVQVAMEEAKRNHKRLGSYIKAIIRKKMTILSVGPNQPPNQADAMDVFFLCEGKIRRKFPDNRTQKPSQQKPKPQQQREEGRATENNQNKPTPKPQQTKPQEKPIPSEPKQKKKNPLLNYIDGQ